ncbi:GNAT family N-acetyltransferase [Kitasatospora sp. NPDC047058]|uniref:GNAT family N-acetyltransferase n=1 Tax=Kitasatospora sp. NPDC047058 TaxID=3155620 RepID=UPI0033E87B0D
MYTVGRLTADELADAAGQLADLLVDTVDGGSSLGFLAPLDHADAAAWWQALVPDVAAGRLLLWAARPDGPGDGDANGPDSPDGPDGTDGTAWTNGTAPAVGRIAGTVQLRPATPANGRHRGEVAKLMVHRTDRGQRLAGSLLAALEAEAAGRGIRLLVLDTETGSPAERMYEAAGWTRVGTVPDYATDPAGVPHPTTLFFKALGSPGSGASVG